MDISITKTDKNFAFLATADGEAAPIALCASDALEEGNIGYRPMQTLLMSLGSCMSIDILMILNKQRQKVTDFRVDVSADRTEGTPSIFKSIIIHVSISGDIKEEKLVKAIDLSREKYCSVYHMMRQDVPLTISHTINPKSE